MIPKRLSAQNFAFSTFLNPALFATQTCPCSNHVTSLINVPGPNDGRISRGHDLTLRWQNLQIHRKDESQKSKHAKYSFLFLFDQNPPATPWRKQNIARTALDAKKSSSPQAASCQARMRARSERPPAGPQKHKKVIENSLCGQMLRCQHF